MKQAHRTSIWAQVEALLNQRFCHKLRYAKEKNGVAVKDSSWWASSLLVAESLAPFHETYSEGSASLLAIHRALTHKLMRVWKSMHALVCLFAYMHKGLSFWKIMRVFICLHAHAHKWGGFGNLAHSSSCTDSQANACMEYNRYSCVFICPYAQWFEHG